jgi:hypothetical protein
MFIAQRVQNIALRRSAMYSVSTGDVVLTWTIRPPCPTHRTPPERCLENTENYKHRAPPERRRALMRTMKPNHYALGLLLFSFLF